VFLQLTLWVALARAFYPWNPCEVDNTCAGTSKRSVASRAAPDEVVTFDLVRRTHHVSTGRDAVRRGLTSDADHTAQPHKDAAEGTTRAPRVASRLTHKHAPLAITKRTNKYIVTVPLPPTASRSAGIYQDGADFSYFVQAKFGSAGKPMYLLLDSGAASTWVMGSTCKSDACLIHDTFGPADSKTLKEDTKGFSITYGTGRVSGKLARDTLSIAGVTMEMMFGLANDTSYDFTHFPFDGILGLSMSTGVTDSFMGLLAEKKAINTRVFSVNLGRSSDGINNGQITFGGVDQAKYMGEIAYTAVSPKANGDWAIPMDDISFNGKSVGITGRLAYIDTGTSHMFGPESDVATLHKNVPGAASSDKVSYTVPCNTDKPIALTFSGIQYTISSKDWISKRDGLCYSNIYGHEVVKGSFLMGDAFLKNVYTVFDGSEKRIGFASKAPLPDVPKNSPSQTIEGSGQPTTSPISPGPDNTPGGSAAAETTANPTSTAAQASFGGQINSSTPVTILCIVAVMALVI